MAAARKTQKPEIDRIFQTSTIRPRKLAALVPYAKNSRTHSDDQIAQLSASIREFGFTAPVMVSSDGGIIAGHGRVLAAAKLGMLEVPTIDEPPHWTPDQRRAYVIADNQLALNAGWNPDILAAELGALRGAGFEMNLLGFSPDQLAGFMPGDGPLTDPDEAPEPPASPISRRGDVWLVGAHRLVCGDATEKADVEAALGGQKPHLMVTDPPYGVDYDPEWRADANKWKGSKVKIGGKAMGKVSNDDLADWRAVWQLFAGDVAYVWHGGLRSVEQAESLEATGFVVRSQIIWNKSSLVISRGDYHWQHEACWYAVRKGKTGHWGGSRTESTVWDIAKPQTSETGHSTQKPVECMKRPIENNSKRGDAVYEPFSGSGTTIIAGEMTGRKVCAIEISPAHVDVAVLRWQAFVGKKATLDATGQTFDEVAEDRTDEATAKERLAEIAENPGSLVSGAELEARLGHV